MYQRKLLATMVSAAIVLVVVTNYCVIQILGSAHASPAELVHSVWPISLPTSVAVVLIMSTLYHTLQNVLAELDRGRLEALELAQHDALTGLANRRLMEEGIDQAIARYRRSGERFSVLMIDLDHFKRVNDLLGHAVGDNLLKEAAGRLGQLVRETDLVARFGGDEFLVLQTNVGRRGDVRRLCSRIVQRMRRPYRSGEREARLPASIGAVIATAEMDSASEYLRAADMALYAAKEDGRNGYRFFSDELDAELRRRDRLEEALRSALKTGAGLAVQFQPQLAATGEISGAEALFRWTHAQLGEIPAVEAIEIAEECHLIDALGEFVVRESARFARQFPSLSVAVNISPVQFARSATLADNLDKIVREEGIAPEQIELELTEQLFIRDGGCESQVRSLREQGFRIALDNFGTGYSSLSYLRRFRVDRLKLDRSFVEEEQALESVAIVRATVTLAHSLGMDVVAEGVESELQERIALEAGCDALQGHRYGAPLNMDEFRRHLRGRWRDAA